MDNLNELRKIAEAEETQKWGDWAFEDDDWDGYCVYINDGGFGRSYVAEKMSQGESEGKSTAEFIATFDPPTVLALLTRLEQAEQERDKFRDSYSLQAQELEKAEQAVARVEQALVEGTLEEDRGNEVIDPWFIRQALDGGTRG